MTNSHLTDEMISAYAAGSASEGAALAAAAHLTYCAVCRRKVETREAVAGALLAEADNEAAPAFDALLALLDEPETKVVAPTSPGPLPAPVAKAIGIDFDAIPWRFRLPGVHEYSFAKNDGEEISLLKVRPGAAIPSHTHEAEELTVVLEGQLCDGDRIFNRGDISIADPSTDHNPRAGQDEDCICLAVLSGGLKFTGPFGRALNLFS